MSFPNARHISIGLKKQDYREIYCHFLENRAYTVVMLDNALVQIMYRFKGSKLIAHRLAFFPAPDLQEFQNAPEWYWHDELFIDVLARTTAPALVRFDYNANQERHRPVLHPKSHLTLGQYEGCRIPVSAPLTPYQFMDFVLRNFYDTPNKSYANKLPPIGKPFAESIDAEERSVMHMTVTT